MLFYIGTLLTGGEERLGGDERRHHRRPQADVDGVAGRRQEEEERRTQRSLVQDGPMNSFGGKFKKLARKFKKSAKLFTSPPIPSFQKHEFIASKSTHLHKISPCP